MTNYTHECKVRQTRRTQKDRILWSRTWMGHSSIGHGICTKDGDVDVTN